MPRTPIVLSALLLAITAPVTAAAQEPPGRPRARDAGIEFGALRPGPLNAITDVPGVRVGHATVRSGDNVRTGVTVILPHEENPFQSKVPAAVVVQNGFGKLIGITQVDELGEIESPIALTNTLCVGRVADSLVGWMLEQKGNEEVRSVNVVVGETNDGHLNDIRGRHVRDEHVREALEAAAAGPVTEGCVGAGTGTICLSFKGGIGTASRKIGNFHVGVLVQSNFGGALTITGVPVQAALETPRERERDDERGSCMIVIATDAPLGARNLRRLARRAFTGMARTGASFSNGSGDYAIAFSTAKSQRIAVGRSPTTGDAVLKNDRMTALFRAVADATEEAIVNSLFAATTTTGNGHTVKALPVDRVLEIYKQKR